MPPPSVAAELPLTVLLVSVAVPMASMPPPRLPAELPLTVLLVSVAVVAKMPPPLSLGGVAADGAVGQRRRAGG